MSEKGQFPLSGDNQATVGQYINDKKHAVSSRGVTRTKAGTILGCSSDCVNELVNKGLLSTTPGPYYRIICSESVREFAKQFVVLNDLAKSLGTSVRALRCGAEEQGYRLVLIKSKRGVTTPFIGRQRVAELHRFIEQQRFDAANRSAAWRDRLSSTEKLSQYLNSMRQAGRPLPRSGKRLNLRKVARASGICRDIFYWSQEARDLIDTAEREDALKHGVDSRTDLELLRSYLDELKIGGNPIPIGRRGKPNKFQIARIAGVNRNIFYESQEANRLLTRFQQYTAASSAEGDGHD